MSASAILPILLQSLSLNDTFTEGAKKLATFVRKTEERFSVPEVLRIILNTCSNPRELEYILFSFLDTCRADFDMLEQARPLRQIRRLIHRAVTYPAGLTSPEQGIIQLLHQKANTYSVEDVVAASRRMATLILQISQEYDATNDERTFLATLLTSEAKILSIRSEWMSDHVDSYDMKAIARMMPLLTVCDEQTSILKDLAKRIENRGPLGRAILTFEHALRTDSFEKWKKKAGSDSTLGTFCSLIEMQRARRVPVKHLVAVATLSRRLHSPDTNPLIWIHHAVSSCTADGFKMEIGTSINAIKKLLDIYQIVPDRSVISGSFTSGAYLQWVNHDMLTRKPFDETEEPSPKELVIRCMNNDALLLRLLENPKVAGTPGLIAKIAYNSRSLSVLQKIATVREMHTGHANAGVPTALLKNPAHIPFSTLRQFINTRYVSLAELKEMVRNPFGVRREIVSEIKTYIDHRYG